jgi:hypothetical protein
MKPNAVAPVIGLLILGLFACVLSPPPVAAATTPPYCGNPANVDSFINHVHFLTSPFVPQPPFNQSPPIDSASLETIAASTNIQSDMIDAFNRSSNEFKKYLCETLDAILINPCTPNSYDPGACGIGDLGTARQTWGLRTPSSPSKRYVALSLALWRGGHAPALHEFETRRLQALIGTLGTPNIPLPEFTSADPDAPGMSVLALLAHESGHVYWYDVFVPSPGGAATVSTAMARCFFAKAAFRYGPWVPPGRWLKFGQIRDSESNAELLELPRLLTPAGSARFAANVHRIYNGRWAGLLGAFSHDEDFVTTVELAVLLNAHPPLSKLEVKIPKGSGRPDMISNLLDGVKSTTKLGRQYECFAALPH